MMTFAVRYCTCELRLQFFGVYMYYCAFKPICGLGLGLASYGLGLGLVALVLSLSCLGLVALVLSLSCLGLVALVLSWSWSWSCLVKSVLFPSLIVCH